jgi:threonine dehydrogenase-like Zn-dependent dehydrogenase
MKAVVFHGVGLIKLDEVPDPQIEKPTDAIIKVVASSICGTDLHMVRGTMAGMKWGTILGHEAVGIVESVGPEVKQFKPGQRVVVCATVACGECIYCQYQEYASCDNANPQGPEAGTAFFGGPILTGSYNGLQAERARIPFADTVLLPLPDEISDDDGLLLADVFPTGYMAAEMADVQAGDIVAVFGCGPVGQMAIASAKLLGASKVIAVDCKPDRLEMAEKQGAIPVNYEEVDPVKTLKALSNGFGPDACIDAVGVDAERPHEGPAKTRSMIETAGSMLEQKQVAPWTVMFGDQWRQGDGPSQVLMWCVESVRKSGVVSIVGVYPHTAKFFPIGFAEQKNLTIRTANCSHRKYIPKLIQVILEGGFSPSSILTKIEGLTDAISAYKHFDKRDPGWTKVELLSDESSSDAAA